MKRNLLPLLGIAFVVALAASGIFYGLFVGQLRKASEGAAKSIVVAVKPLDRGTVLKPADLKLSSWAGQPPPGAFARVEEATGKTLYAALEENEPLTTARLSANQSGGGLGVSKGMRALSVRVVDSAGLIPYLHSGTRVDVQAIRYRNSPDARLRTVLENVEVLGVQTQEGQTQWATVTLLANPEDSDRLALADSGANIRVLLRNSLDTDTGARAGVQMAALFDEGPPSRHAPSISPSAGPRIEPRLVPAANRTSAADIPAQRPADPFVELVVRVGGASPHAMEDLQAGIPGFQAGRSIQVVTLPREESGQHFWASLEQKHHVELFSLSHLIAANESDSRLQSGKTWKSASGTGGFSMRFHARLGPNQTLQLRLQPEVSVPAGLSGISTRKVVTDLKLADGQSVIVTGLSEPGEMPTLAGRLFSDRIQDAGDRDLVVLVTPRLIKAQNAVASGGR